jgi:hypothetical protein
MSTRPRTHTPTHYELRIEGHLDEHWSTWFGNLTLSHEDDGTTTLRGAVTDQAELHGLLAKVRDLGATLLSVEATDSAPGHPPADVNELAETTIGLYQTECIRDDTIPPRTLTGS